MNIFKSLELVCSKFNDLETFFKEKMSLLKRWWVKKFKKNKNIMIFIKSAGRFLIKFNGLETFNATINALLGQNKVKIKFKAMSDHI